MSTKEVTVSEEGQGEVENASVYDILYHDDVRIASFLSQFDNNGLLTGLTAGDSVVKGQKRGKKFGLGGSSPVGGGNLSFELGPGEAGSESLQRVYDPYWANALQFLDVLHARNLIQREVNQARIGQFILATGSLILSDLNTLKALWELPSIRKSMINAAVEAAKNEEEEQEPQNRQERRKRNAQNRNKRAPKEPEIPEEMAIAMEALPHMPHGGQIHLVDENDAYWAPVKERSLVAPMTELILKHGPKIAGQWSMVGILDALPWEENAEMTAMEMVRIGMLGDSVPNLALNLAGPIRQMMGRPLLSYGITPLLIFREISPR